LQFLWLEEGCVMAKINARKDTGKLYFDFRVQGIRCREQTSLADTPTNRKRMQVIMQKIEASITLGQFNYADFFPNSLMVKKFEEQNQRQVSTNEMDVSIPTVGEFKIQWFDEMLPTWRNSYVETVSSVFESHIIPAFGKVVVSHITKANILSFRAQLAKPSPENGKTRANATVNKVLKMFRLMIREASERYQFSDPFMGVKLLKEQRTDIHPLSLNEVKLFLECVRPDFYNYFKLRFFTGLRSGEITGLLWEHIDFPRKQILVRQSIVRGRVEYTKNDGSQREINMTVPVWEALQAQFEVTGEGGYVFTNREGKPLDNHNVCNRIWYPMLRLLGLKKRRMYETRHTAATIWMAAGENPEWIARQLGHVNTEMLFKVYSRFVPNLTRRDGTAFESLMENNFGEDK